MHCVVNRRNQTNSNHGLLVEANFRSCEEISVRFCRRSAGVELEDLEHASRLFRDRWQEGAGNTGRIKVVSTSPSATVEHFCCRVSGAVVKGCSHHMSKRKERLAQRYIRLLSPLEHAARPVSTKTDSTIDDLHLYAELIGDGYIGGVVERALLLADEREKEEMLTSIGILKKLRWPTYKFVGSALTGAAITHVLWILQSKP